jgi:hypothetical protein
MFYNDIDDIPTINTKIIVEDNNKSQEELNYDWEKEGERLHSLNILQITEYQMRQRKLMSYLEEKISNISGMKIQVDKKRKWCKVFVYRISDPGFIWVVKNNLEKHELVGVHIPGQCGIDEFEISLKDMYTLNVDISHISDHNGSDLFEEIIDDYPTVTVTPEKVVEILLEFQRNGNL